MPCRVRQSRSTLKRCVEKKYTMQKAEIGASERENHKQTKSEQVTLHLVQVTHSGATP